MTFLTLSYYTTFKNLFRISSDGWGLDFPSDLSKIVSYLGELEGPLASIISGNILVCDLVAKIFEIGLSCCM